MKRAGINDEMKNLLAVIQHFNQTGKNPDEVEIFRELHESAEHHGWEIELTGIFILTNWLSKHGYLTRYFGGNYQITERGRRVFGAVPA